MSSVKARTACKLFLHTTPGYAPYISSEAPREFMNSSYFNLSLNTAQATCNCLNRVWCYYHISFFRHQWMFQ